MLKSYHHTYRTEIVGSHKMDSIFIPSVKTEVEPISIGKDSNVSSYVNATSSHKINVRVVCTKPKTSATVTSDLNNVVDPGLNMSVEKSALFAQNTQEISMKSSDSSVPSQTTDIKIEPGLLPSAINPFIDESLPSLSTYTNKIAHNFVSKREAVPKFSMFGIDTDFQGTQTAQHQDPPISDNGINHSLYNLVGSIAERSSNEDEKLPILKFLRIPSSTSSVEYKVTSESVSKPAISTATTSSSTQAAGEEDHPKVSAPHTAGFAPPPNVAPVASDGVLEPPNVATGASTVDLSASTNVATDITIGGIYIPPNVFGVSGETNIVPGTKRTETINMKKWSKWKPFPVKVGSVLSTANQNSNFTPFQLEQLNHQIRMYRLFRLMEFNDKNKRKNTQTVNNALRAAGLHTTISTVTFGAGIKVGLNVGVMNNLLVPLPLPRLTRARTAKVDLTLVPLPGTPETKKRGRKRVIDLNATGTLGIVALAPVAKKKNSTKKNKKLLTVPDQPVPTLDCNFCAMAVPTFDSLTVESCQHIFCRDCLKNFVEHNTEPQIPCPIKDESHCNGFLSDPEIKEVVSEEVFQKYLSRSLASALEADSDLVHCYAPECTGVFLLEEGFRAFYCPVCAKLNCINCKSTHDRPCKRGKRKHNEASGLIDLGDSDDSDGESDTNMAIAMKFPQQETEAEKKMRQEWEASWEQLVKKFNGGKDPNGESESSTATVENSLWNEAFTQMEVFADVIKTTEEFECPVCFLDIEIGEGVILQECFHRFCRDCLAATIEHSETPQVKCPFQSGNYSCQEHILDKEAKTLVSVEIYDKLLKKSLSAAEMGMSNSFHCQSVNCTGWVEVEAQVSAFKCFICHKLNCVRCKAIHASITCVEYQSRLREGEVDQESKEALNLLIDEGNAMRCPTCKVVIIKNGGCDGMTCVVCHTMICWATKGPRWGPKGRGDNTGGCRCGFDGKKCHPKCGNCH